MYLGRKRTRRRRQSKVLTKTSGGRRLCKSNEKLYSSEVNVKSCNKSSGEFVQNTNPSSSSEESNEFGKFSSLQQLNGNNISFNKTFRELNSQSSDVQLCKDDSIICHETSSFDRVKVVRINCSLPTHTEQIEQLFQENKPHSKVDNEDQTSDEARHDSAVQDVSSVELETDQPHSDTELENASGTDGRQVGTHLVVIIRILIYTFYLSLSLLLTFTIFV